MVELKPAREELLTSSMEDIERATAEAWGGRAVASYQLSREGRTLHERFRRFYEGETFRQEALEHASMVDAGLVAEVQQAIDPERAAALREIEAQAA